MQFNDKHNFDQPAAKVITMFSDKAYFERKYKALGYTGIEVLEHSADGGKFRIMVRYSAKSDASIPDFAKKFLAPTNVVTQTDSWDVAKKTGRIEAEIRGVPVKVTSDMTLKDEDGGCVNQMKWNISCGIPFIGGKLEDVVGGDIKAKSKTDLAQSRELLKAY